MILSLSHRFIFVHVSKSAGTSIQVALRNFVHEPDCLWIHRLRNRMGLEWDYRRIRFPEHVTAHRLRRQLPPDIYDSYFKFAFVRNPWDWVVSQYHYLLSTPSHRHHGRVCAMSGLEEYIEFEIARNKRSQSEFIIDENGKILVDYIGRFENLSRDFASVCDKLNVSAELPRINTTVHEDYRTYYSDSSRERVAEHWGEDIARFFYNFENQNLSPISITSTADCL